MTDGETNGKTVVRTLKFEICPTEEQRKKIDITINCCRFVYNKMIERNDKVHFRRKEYLSRNAMQNLLPQMKTYLPWLREADSQALKNACYQVDDAYRKFFDKRSGHPKFKSKRDNRQSYRTTNAKTIHYKPGSVKIPCLGWIKHFDPREIIGTICFATVIRDGSKYYASIAYKYEKETNQIEYKDCIGLDYKADGLYVDSEGNSANMPKWYKLSEKQIAKEQRKLSRKQGSHKGEERSNNYLKQLKRLQRKHRHIANQRKDFLHKESTKIANRYDLVAVEDLNLIEISKQFGKSTMSNGYGAFVQMLKYKLEDRGKTLIKVDRYFPSSQMCSCCGFQNSSVKNLQIREWMCPNCGSLHDRDHNAAKNILAEGLRVAT